MKTENEHDKLKDYYVGIGKLTYSLARFGDHLAEREGYKTVRGMEAIHYYIVHKFRWRPSDVLAMNYEELQFLMREEMNGWTDPK